MCGDVRIVKMRCYVCFNVLSELNLFKIHGLSIEVCVLFSREVGLPYITLSHIHEQMKQSGPGLK